MTKKQAKNANTTLRAQPGLRHEWEHALRPCPFCGSSKVDYSRMEEAEDLFVACHHCGITVNFTYDLTEDELIHDWNQRPPEDQKDEMIVRLAADLDQKNKPRLTLRTWQVDTHQLNLMVQDAGRPWEVVVYDRQQRKVIAAYLSDTVPDAEVIRIALKRTIDGYGRPDCIIMDHGQDDGMTEFQGVPIHQASPHYRRQSKPIERYFRDFDKAIQRAMAKHGTPEQTDADSGDYEPKDLRTALFSQESNE